MFPSHLEKTPDPTVGPYHYRRLPNGLRVVVVEYPHTPILAVGWWVRYGHFVPDSLSDPIGWAMLEGLFGGTRKYPTRELVNQRMQQLGMAWALSDKEEYIGLGMVFPRDNFREGMDFAAQLTRWALMDSADFEVVRSTVEEEWDWRNRNHGFRLQVTAHQWLYVLNRPEQTMPPLLSMENLSWRRVREEYRRIWRPDNALLMIAGGVSATKVFEMVERLWGDWQASGPHPYIARPIPAYQPLPHNLTFVEVGSAAQKALYVQYYQGPGMITDPDAEEALQLLVELVNYPYGRFQRAMRAAGADDVRFRYVGSRMSLPAYFELRADSAALPRAVAALRREIERMAADSTYFSDDELEYAIRRRSNYYEWKVENFFDFLDESVPHAWSIAGVYYFFEYADRIRRISRRRLARALERYLGRARWVGGLLLPADYSAERIRGLVRNVRWIGDYRWRIPKHRPLLSPYHGLQLRDILFLMQLNPDLALDIHVTGPDPYRMFRQVADSIRARVPRFERRFRRGRMHREPSSDYVVTFTFSSLDK